MRLSKIANAIGNSLLRFDNHRVICPPGELEPGEGPLVLVPTIMRSGTHILIDTILNNFPRYKRRPLYVNLDVLLRVGDMRAGDMREELVDRLLGSGGYVVKTHFPQGFTSLKREPFIRKIAERSRIIMVTRDLEQTFRSSISWGMLPVTAEKEKYMEDVRRFQVYWEQFDCLSLSFSELVNKTTYPDLIERIAKHIGAKPRSKTFFVPSSDRRFQVYVAKAMTRMLGKHSYIVNTTIRFALTKPKK